MIQPPHGSPTAGTDDGEALIGREVGYIELYEHIKNGGEIGVPVFHKSGEFESVAPRHDAVGVVLAVGAVSENGGGY